MFAARGESRSQGSCIGLCATLRELPKRDTRGSYDLPPGAVSQHSRRQVRNWPDLFPPGRQSADSGAPQSGFYYKPVCGELLILAERDDGVEAC
jgi:hypothetical protein